MTETTTIQISRETKQELDDLKNGDKESYESVLQRIIDGYDVTEYVDETQARKIAQEEINDRVVPKALE